MLRLRSRFRSALPTIVALVLLSAATAGAQSVDLAAATDDSLRPGDQIRLNFLRERELSQTVTVNERGDAPFPKLGVIHVATLSIAQLQDTLTTRYSEYLRSPEFEFAVLRRIVIQGEVRMPNVYMLDATTTLRDAIARAGGLTDAGSRKKVAIIRDGVRIAVPDWDRGTGVNTPLRSGDQVFVGRKNWFQINALSVVSTAVLVASFVISVAR